MYRTLLSTPDQALVHLAFHCCLKDGELQNEELDFLSSTFVAKGINKSLNLKEEMQQYQSYYKNISDESSYVQFLIETIRPNNKLALFAFCTEIIYRDNNISISEEVLLNKIAGYLYVKDSENLAIQNLITELNDVEQNNAF
ncbi:TerB family tellurite resistance protein [Flavisolibacter nicotianae]|uniref:TerB family tellurite resistance protein n=1 Tax=Flavisolibacter nicotianae TaxID=2364882 RepID=UPI000EB1031A|nr:TerB family tellurite resistance protein [Flavisolibacter nicotianae]